MGNKNIITVVKKKRKRKKGTKGKKNMPRIVRRTRRTRIHVRITAGRAADVFGERTRDDSNYIGDFFSYISFWKVELFNVSFSIRRVS